MSVLKTSVYESFQSTAGINGDFTKIGNVQIINRIKFTTKCQIKLTLTCILQSWVPAGMGKGALAPSGNVKGWIRFSHNFWSSQKEPKSWSPDTFYGFINICKCICSWGSALDPVGKTPQIFHVHLSLCKGSGWQGRKWSVTSVPLQQITTYTITNEP